MLDKFAKDIDWASYNEPADPVSQKIKKYQTEIMKGGGPITKKLRSLITDGIPPTEKLVVESTTYGYYPLTRVREDVASAVYTDIWILATEEADSLEL